MNAIPLARRSAGFLVAAALTLACGTDPEGVSPPPATATRAEAPLAPGTLEITVVDGHASIRCSEIPRRALLRRLAETAGFSLDLSELPPARISLRIDDSPLAAVLPELLEGVPYQVDFEVDATTGRHILVWLGVGSGEPDETPILAAEEAATTTPPSSERSAQSLFARAKRRFEGMSAEERARIDDEWNARADEREPELLRLLEDPDPSIRAEAILDLPIEGNPEKRDERMERLAGLVGDPESMVRLAAIERLGEIESRDSLEALLPALNDPNREVVMEAISAIEDIDDPAAIPHLKPLLQDRDEDVREAAGDAIDWIQD